MANPNNQEPLSMEDRVCKLEAQVGELRIKIDTQFQATVEKLRVKVSNLSDEMFNFRNEILEALGLDSSASPLMNPVQRGSTVQTPSMAPQPYQLSPPLVQLKVGRSDRSAPLVSAEESGYLVGGLEAVKIAEDSELLMTTQEVKVCECADPCLVDNGMIKEEIAVEVIDKNEQLLAPVNRVEIDDENDRDNEDGFNNSVEQMEKSLVVEGELMKNSHTPKMPYELLMKQAELIAMIESPSLGLRALNPIGDNGEFTGMNMMVIFYPGGIKPKFSLNAQTNSSVQCVFDYGVLNTSACGSVMKLVGKTPNDYVNPDEVFALEVVVQDRVLVGNESDIVLLYVTLLSIALKTRGGSNVNGSGINIDFAFLIRIVLTTMRLVLQVEVELDVFYGNPRMQGCSEFPFDPGGILQSMSRPKSTVNDDFGS
nr:heat shock 70 kDa protein 6, chloroplastic-like [Ipomoea batatas]